MTVAAALSYGELAAMMPKAGGQYIYLREAYSPLWGFLVRLDAVSGYPDGHDCRRGRRFCHGSWASCGRRFRRIPGSFLPLHYPPEICDQPFGPATGRAAPDFFFNASQYSRIEAREADSERIHIGEDAGTGRADPGWSFPRTECRRDSRQFHRASGRFTIRRRSSRERTG